MRRSFRNPTDGGGNTLPKQELKVRRWAAQGDSVCASVIADRLHELGYVVNWQTHQSIVPLMKRIPSIKIVEPYKTHCDVDLDRAYEKYDGTQKRRDIHFHEAFFEQARSQLRVKGIDIGKPLNCRPRMIVTDHEKSLAFEQLKQYPKPWVFMCPGSLYFRVRQVPNYIWEAAAKRIEGTKFWIGLTDGPPGIVDLKCRELDMLIGFLSVADLLISPDTGPAHHALAIGTQVIVINQSSSPEKHFSDLCDYESIGLGLDCENCCLTKCPKGEFAPPCQNQNPDQIAAAANRKLKRDIVSCVIPTFNAPVERLTKCINAVLPQVDEIIVSAAADGRFPAGAPHGPKIRYVQSSKSDLGFAKNVNYGMRFTSGSNILVLNDDCRLQPNVVARLKEEMKPGVALVSHLLRYDDGRLYYSTKPRGPNGFYHLDHGGWIPSITGTFEIENACGCSFLINRKAFYEVKCMDEAVWAYCDDDDLSMRLRLHNWKLMYTSDVFGNHEGSATSKTFSDFHQRMHESNLWFGKKWNAYIEHNKNNPGLGNFSYLVGNGGRKG
jgi:GT2 family glycosyltransferase